MAVKDQSESYTSVEMAIAVLTERISQLPKADREDLFQLLPALTSDDLEERQSAVVAMNEILAQSDCGLQEQSLAESDADELETWRSYVSKKIRECRDAAGLTQSKLAEAADLPQSHISRLERGEHSPSHKTLEKIAKALDIPISDLDPSG